ncbi:ABC transporter substrate-binding protein [Aminobacter sp. BA135]|uniref:ABC transporter substrate-binding protein n=1 Tax=Aminobacter sp. BA135 TaxID=537596 RepID=UPI003D7AF952
MTKARSILLSAVAALAFSTAATYAQDLTAYCPMSEDDCASVLKAFEADSGISSNFVRMGAGEVLARVRAEAANPQAGLWLAGTADLFIQGAAEGLLEAHASASIDKVDAKFRSKDNSWTPMAVSPIAFFYNPKYLTQLGAEPPTSWEDFAKPVFKGAVVLTHPASSGTASVVLATMVQIYGEDKAFEILKATDPNVLQYSRSAGSLTQMVASGEVAISQAFTHGLEAALKQGFPIEVSFPKEGTGYELNSAAVIAKAPEAQREAAKKFLDWVLTDAGQKALGATHRESVIPGFKNPDLQIKTSDIKLIDYDSKWAGENRGRLLERYEADVRAASAAK